MKLFGEESALGRFLNRLYILVCANLLFLLFSVPVFTIGASLSALHYTLLKYQRGDRLFKVASTFWRGFKDSFLKATVCLIVLVALALVQLLEISWCSQIGGAMLAFRMALIGLLILEGILSVYLFPVIAAFRGGIPELLKNALYFAFSQPLRMLACVALSAVPLLVTYLFLPLLPLWAFLWLIIGFAAVSYGMTHIMLPQFIPFLPEVDICGDIIPPDMEDDPDIVLGDANDAGAPDEKTLQEMMKYGL